MIKHCAFVRAGLENIYDHGMLQLVHIEIERALAASTHGHILRTHMNECTLLNNVMNDLNQEMKHQRRAHVLENHLKR
jgi:hypothetical protein